MQGFAVTIVLALVATVLALPAVPHLSKTVVQRFDLAKRQNAAAAAAGINDIDILQFALTLEFLESAFYSTAFSQLSDTSLSAAGLSSISIASLKQIASTEGAHTTTLLSAIAAAGTQPVQACTYNFNLTDTASFIATASILENVGVSAYMGAAPLVSSGSILTVAAEILTVEARHQTFLRTIAGTTAIPSAFDTPLGIRSVFTLAAGFISSCPTGSNLNIVAFPALTITTTGAITGGTNLQVNTAATGATACSFTNGGLPGGSAFVSLVAGGCVVPQGLAGITYVHLTSAMGTGGVLTDDLVVAGVGVVDIV